MNNLLLQLLVYFKYAHSYILFLLFVTRIIHHSFITPGKNYILHFIERTL